MCGVAGGWRDGWDDPDDHVELRASAEATERRQRRLTEMLGVVWRQELERSRTGNQALIAARAAASLRHPLWTAAPADLATDFTRAAVGVPVALVRRRTLRDGVELPHTLAAASDRETAKTVRAVTATRTHVGDARPIGEQGSAFPATWVVLDRSAGHWLQHTREGGQCRRQPTP